MNKIELIVSLKKEVEELIYRDGKLDGVLRRAIMLTTKVFGESTQYTKDINKIKFTPSLSWSGMEASVYVSSFNSGKKMLLNTINTMIEDLELTPTIHQSKDKSVNSINNSKKVFVVHGHNEEMKQSSARFFEKILYEPIILHEQANQGKTIIEKFANNSDVSFAIILLSADDIAYSKIDKIENAKFRARQNVILEMGFFLGKLGRERVLVLHEKVKDFEFPSDYQGVIYINYDDQGLWKFSVIKEMKALGHIVDANVLM